MGSFVGRPSARPMHADAEGTSVELRRPDLDQLPQWLLKTAIGTVGLETRHGVVCVWCDFGDVDSRLHGI